MTQQFIDERIDIRFKLHSYFYISVMKKLVLLFAFILFSCSTTISEEERKDIAFQFINEIYPDDFVKLISVHRGYEVGEKYIKDSKSTFVIMEDKRPVYSYVANFTDSDTGKKYSEEYIIYFEKDKTIKYHESRGGLIDRWYPE